MTTYKEMFSKTSISIDELGDYKAFIAECNKRDAEKAKFINNVKKSTIINPEKKIIPSQEIKKEELTLVKNDELELEKTINLLIDECSTEHEKNPNPWAEGTYKQFLQYPPLLINDKLTPNPNWNLAQKNIWFKVCNSIDVLHGRSIIFINKLWKTKLKSEGIITTAPIFMISEKICKEQIAISQKLFNSIIRYVINPVLGIETPSKTIYMKGKKNVKLRIDSSKRCSFASTFLDINESIQKIIKHLDCDKEEVLKLQNVLKAYIYADVLSEEENKITVEHVSKKLGRGIKRFITPGFDHRVYRSEQDVGVIFKNMANTIDEQSMCLCPKEIRNEICSKFEAAYPTKKIVSLDIKAAYSSIDAIVTNDVSAFEKTKNWRETTTSYEKKNLKRADNMMRFGARTVTVSKKTGIDKSIVKERRNEIKKEVETIFSDREVFGGKKKYTYREKNAILHSTRTMVEELLIKCCIGHNATKMNASTRIHDELMMIIDKDTSISTKFDDQNDNDIDATALDTRFFVHLANGSEFAIDYLVEGLNKCELLFAEQQNYFKNAA